MINFIRKFFSIALIAVILVFSIAYLAYGHSRVYKDIFEFDNSNENRSVALLNFLNQAVNLNSSNQAASTNNVNSINAVAATTPCVNGEAGAYTCKDVDLNAFVPKNQMGGGDANTNDIWGWTDPSTGAEIAIIGRTNGTSFVDVSDAENPVYKGFLPSHDNGQDTWRDIKTYNNHAFIVADGPGNPTHGMQVFDLTQLRNVSSPQNFTATAHFNGFGNAHNIVINEDSGFAYAVGSNKCSGGLYVVNVSNPTSPQDAGCFSSDGYTHDAQCINYNGPDSSYSNREICFGYNEDTLTIVNMDNKSNPVQISRTGYDGSAYTHQGWVTADHRYLLLNDEQDELNGVNTTTLIWDVSDLDNPSLIKRHVHDSPAIDHNLYVHDGHVYESNYRAGLRILSVDDIANGNIEEVAFFDIVPGSDSAQFSGNWSNYPYFASGKIILSDIENGLFVVNADLSSGGSSSGGSSSGGSSSGGSSSGGSSSGGSSSGGQLENGVPVSGLSASTGNDVVYSINVPSGASNLVIKIEGGSGDADLYTRAGSVPTDSTYACRPYAGGNSETCTEPNPSSGTWYARVKAYEGFSNVTLTASYTGGGSSSGGSSSGGSSSGGSSSGGSSSGGSSGGNELQNGVPVSGLTASTGNDVVYSINVPSGASNLVISINGGSGDADLYTRAGAVPTDSTYACRPYAGGNSETCTEPNPSSGVWYARVKAYEAFSNVTITASYDGGGSSSGGSSSGGSSSGGSSSGGSSSGGGNELQNNVAKNTSGAQNQDSFYTMNVPAGASNLSFAISGGSGDADLYVRFGQQPTASNYDCRPYAGGNNENCDVSNVQTGTYHIMVRGYEAYSNVNLIGSYDN